MQTAQERVQLLLMCSFQSNAMHVDCNCLTSPPCSTEFQEEEVLYLKEY